MCEFIFGSPGIIAFLLKSVKEGDVLLFFGLATSIMLYYYAVVIFSKIMLKILAPFRGGFNEISSS